MTGIHIETYGHGQPLVMLHGWAMHTGVWRDFARQLSQHCQVICVDLPGHGRSHPLEPFILQSVSDVLLEAIPVERFCILGWSLGATFAMAMAERAPQRVEKLMVLAGNPRFLQSTDWPGVKPEVLDGFVELLKTDIAQTLIRFLALQVNGLAHGKRLLQALKAAMQECPPPRYEVLQTGLEILKTSDLRNFVQNARLPVKFILGGKDALIPLELAHRVREINPKLELTILESAGHAPFLSHSEQLSRAVIEFL